MSCTCGIPNRANYYTEVIIGRDIPGGTETTYVDIYTCDEHTDEDDPRSMFRFDDADAWDVIESTTTHLR